MNTRTSTTALGESVELPDFDSAPPVTLPAAGPAIAARVDGAHGMDSEANFKTLYDFCVVARAALVARGIIAGP